MPRATRSVVWDGLLACTRLCCWGENRNGESLHPSVQRQLPQRPVDISRASLNFARSMHTATVAARRQGSRRRRDVTNALLDKCRTLRPGDRAMDGHWKA